MMQALRPRDSHRGSLGAYQLQEEEDDSQQLASTALQGISRTAATQQQRFFHMPRFQTNFQKQQNYFNVQQFKQHLQQMQGIEFDGKRLRKAVARKTVDYNSSILQAVEARVWQRDFRDRRAIQPDVGYYTELIPPVSMIENPINAVTTKFVRTSTNKMRCPIFCVAWTPEGRRLVTGASSGEFTLWNGLTFNFETILQAHDSPVRCMMWSHSDVWMVTGDHAGYVKYWQSNMNNVKMFQAHKEPLRGIRWEYWTQRPFIVHYQAAGNSEIMDHSFRLLSVLSFTFLYDNFIVWCWCLGISTVFHGLYRNFISHAIETTSH